MPFGIRKTGKGYKVVNKHTGRVLGTHGSEGEARAQLAAVNINYYGDGDAEKKAALFRALERISGVSR